jgi:predicted nucleic acid-binding protein
LPSGEKIVVVADANVILAAITGRAAQKAFYQGIKVHISIVTLSEVMKYADYFCTRYNIPFDVARRQLGALPMQHHPPASYEEMLPKATKLMKDKDPDDADVLALALKLDAPIWSNDNHFKGLPIKRYTTAQFLNSPG